MAMAEWELRQRQKGNVEGAKAARKLLEQYGDVPLPGEPPLVNLRDETYALLAQVREPSDEERKRFEAKGFIFLSVEPVTLGQVEKENPSHFPDGGLGYLRSDYKPPVAMKVAINPGQLWIPGSFSLSRKAQLELTQAHSREEIETIDPDARAVMLPATALAQLSIVYGRNHSNILITAFARTLDDAKAGIVNSFGMRRLGGGRFELVGSNPHEGNRDIGVVSAVVFTGNRK